MHSYIIRWATVRITTDHRNKSGRQWTCIMHTSITCASHVLDIHNEHYGIQFYCMVNCGPYMGSPFLFPSLKSFDEDKRHALLMIELLITPSSLSPWHPSLSSSPHPFLWVLRRMLHFLHIEKHCLHNTIIHWTRENKKKLHIGTQAYTG